MTGDAKTARRSGRWNLEPIRLGLSVMGAVFLVALFFLPSHGYDLHAFWALNPRDPYTVTDDLIGYGVFRYAPPVALLLAPLGLLPWEGIVILWLGLQLAALYFVAGRWALALVLFPPVWHDMAYGNVNIFYAALIVGGFRYPGVWSLALLTKVTPGVGLLWFVVRREWRSLGWALGITGLLIGGSLIVQGTGVWDEWFAVLARSTIQPIPPDALPIPILPRLALAILVVAYAGLTDRRWLLPVGFVLAIPTLWVLSFAPLVAWLGSRDHARVLGAKFVPARVGGVEREHETRRVVV